MSNRDSVATGVIDRRTVLRGVFGLTLSTLVGGTHADELSSKPFRFIVPAPPGGGTDTLARLISGALTTSAKWQFVVENVPGAGGNIGFDRVAKALPDGHTIAMGESSNLIVNQFLFNNIPFKIESDLMPIALVAKVPLVLVVAKNSPYQSVAELVAASKKKSLSFASAGNGTLGHLMGEFWKGKDGLNLMHVPYRGAAQAMTDVAGGQADFFFASVTSGLPLINAGKVRGLMVMATTRSPLLGDVPTASEVGLIGMEAYVVFGVIGPAGIPAPVAERLNQEINAVLSNPEVSRALAALGADKATIGGDIDSFKRLLQQERTKWSRVVINSGAKVD